MALFDLPIDELRTYRSASVEPSDFDAFWAKTLQETREHDLDARFEPVDTGLRTVQVHDVTFAGFGGHPVKGWLTVPSSVDGPLPTVVEYIGYGGGRALPHTHLLWASAGFAHFVMDTRGQGSAWGGGETPDPVGSAPAFPGFMTRGSTTRDLLLPAAVHGRGPGRRGRPLASADRRLPHGGHRHQPGRRHHDRGRWPRTGSGGGGADVPFLCDFPRATTLTDRNPYREIGNYLQTHRGRTERVMRTLSYFDGVHFAARGRAPALFSAALEDQTCPPSTVFAAFNAWAHDDKKIEVYDFNDHEGGGPYQEAVKLRWLPARL